MMKQIALRRSIRKYLNKPIDDKIIMNLIDSARVAPSGSNTQPWHFIIIKDQLIKQQIAKVSNNQQWMLTAPVFIACVADIKARIPTEDIIINEESSQNELKQIIRDTSIAIEHVVLEAINEELGTCWVAWFSQNEIRPILGIPNNKYLVAIITVGYPNEQPKVRERKDIKDIIHYDKW